MQFIFPPIGAGTMGTGEYRLSAFGAVGDGVTDDLGAVQAAIDSGEPLVVGRGTYLLDGQITLRPHLRIRGLSKTEAIFKQAPGTNATLFIGNDIHDISFGGFTIDGNKANQLITANCRAIQISADTRDCTDLYLHDLLVKDIQDHGIFYTGTDAAYRCGVYSMVERLTLLNIGSEAHLDAGGPGGSGFVGGYGSNRFFACDAINCYLNGFKAAGVYKGCTVTGVDHEVGGAFETEGVVGSIPANITYDDCHAVNLRGGWRFNGTSNVCRIVNCTAREIGYSAITAFNTIAELHVDQFTAVNCGKLGGERPSGGGFDVVSLVDITSAEPSHAFLSNIRGVDDQETPTMEYGVWVGEGWTEVHIGGENEFVGLTSGAFLFEASTLSDPLSSISGSTKGWSLQDKNFTPATITGTTSLTTLMPQHTIIRKEFPWGTMVEIFNTGTVTGTAGTKTIYASLQGINVAAVTFAAGESGAWMVRSLIERRSHTIVQITTKGARDGAATTETYNSYSYPSGDDLTYELKVILGNGADSVDQLMRVIRAR